MATNQKLLEAVDGWAAETADAGDVELAWAIRGFMDYLLNQPDDAPREYFRSYRLGNRAANSLLNSL